MNKFILLGTVLTTIIAGGAFAEEAKTTTPNEKTSAEITPEQREKMASYHEKMAVCLRSNRSLSECRREMRQSCPQMEDKTSGCPMAEMGGRGMGMMNEGSAGGSTAAVGLPKDIISMEKAEAMALKEFSGTVKSGELEQEQGRWVYSFDVAGGDKNTHEVWVDAKNGKIIKHKVESASEEASEQKVHESNS